MAASGVADAVFGVDALTLATQGRYQALYYAGLRRHAHTLPIVTNATSAAAANTTFLAPMIIKSHGRHLVWPTATGIDVRPGVSQLWTRWRYARMSNHSVTLSATPLPTAAASARFACATAGAADGSWCTLSNVYMDTVMGYNYTIVIDPERPRGLLPARLLFLLTERRVQARSMAIRPASATALTQDLAAATLCVTLRPVGGPSPSSSSITLCDDDGGYFDMATAGGPVVLGGAYWRRNHTLVEVDGWAGTVAVQYAPPDPVAVAAWQWAAVAVYAAAFFIYAFWQWDETRMGISQYMVHRAAGKGATWPVSWRLNVLTLALLPVSVVAAVVAWIGGTAAGRLGQAPPVVDTIDFAFLAGTLTAHVGAHLILAAIVWLGWEQPTAPACPLARCGEDGDRDTARKAQEARQCARVRRWWARHEVGLRVAWVRNLVPAVVACADMALAAMPLAYAGGAAGNDMLVFFLLPPLLLLAWHHTYYATFLAGLALGSPTRRAATVLAAVGEVATMGLVAAAALATYVRPLFESAAVLFGASQMNAAAVTLGCFVISSAMLCALAEAVHALSVVDALAPSSPSKRNT